MKQFIPICPNCGNQMNISGFSCKTCEINVQGNVTVPRLLKLEPDEIEFIEAFVLSGGSLKEVGKIFRISYPTVRLRLNKVIAKLKSFYESEQNNRIEILEKIEKGEITAKEAVDLLKYGKMEDIQSKKQEE